MTTKAILQRWSDRILEVTEPTKLELIAGDASPRQYYRLTLPRSNAIQPLHCQFTGGTWVAVASPASENNAAFLHVCALFEKAGVRVPTVAAADLGQGFFLLEDLGNDVLLPMLSEHTVDDWYTKALSALKTLASIEPKTANLPRYDAIKLQHELDLFKDWFVPELLGLPVDDDFEQLFSRLSETLIVNATEQPQVVVHRDFHSRNLMRLATDELAVIDFQDAVLGPVTYDVVSLLKDCYVRWPRDRQLAWLEEYQALLLTEQHAEVGVPFATVVQWFDLMGLQRHLKVLGIFSRLSVRDGKSAYLDDLPRVLAYVTETVSLCGGNFPAIDAFAAWFSSVILPACQNQSWYQEIDIAGIDT